jgi:diketogulonate reductase-like aldo/keto reductase
LEGSRSAACFCIYSSQSISWKREKRLPPVINQIEVHPLMTQEENIAYNHELGLQVEAWGPFGQGDIDVVGHPVLQSLAQKYQKTASQIVLRWIVQRNLITIPRAKPSHFAENLEIMTFET